MLAPDISGHERLQVIRALAIIEREKFLELTIIPAINGDKRIRIRFVINLATIICKYEEQNKPFENLYPILKSEDVLGPTQQWLRNIIIMLLQKNNQDEFTEMLTKLKG